jgi:hypothetical protein
MLLTKIKNLENYIVYDQNLNIFFAYLHQRVSGLPDKLVEFSLEVEGDGKPGGTVLPSLVSLARLSHPPANHTQQVLPSPD